mmetsp:Transcript_18180/g.38411  ORF Transcript_18180/g.38411 Transcript_18180/m.38411 type:complete len:110 (-) Transcript_18180:114-443(-)
MRGGPALVVALVPDERVNSDLPLPLRRLPLFGPFGSFGAGGPARCDSVFWVPGDYGLRHVCADGVRGVLQLLRLHQNHLRFDQNRLKLARIAGWDGQEVVEIVEWVLQL